MEQMGNKHAKNNGGHMFKNKIHFFPLKCNLKMYFLQQIVDFVKIVLILLYFICLAVAQVEPCKGSRCHQSMNVSVNADLKL